MLQGALVDVQGLFEVYGFTLLPFATAHQPYILECFLYRARVAIAD